MPSPTKAKSGRRTVGRASLLATVAETLRRRALCEAGMSLLVAVSGGPDSVALLHALHALAPAWRLSLSAVHCNYGLRGQESEDDEAFVLRLCADLRIPCHVRRLHLGPTTSRRAGGSLQERARELRYAVFQELAAVERVDRVALGHTADDQAETVLLWMIRGAGVTGLSGMPPRRDRLFIRPLLDATREEVLAFLAARVLPYRTDSSNQRPTFLRNRVRHQLVPLMKTFNASIVRVLARQADLLTADETYLETQTARAFDALACRSPQGYLVLDRGGLTALPVALQRRMVRRAVKEVSGTEKPPSLNAVSTILDRIVGGRSGSMLMLSRAIVRRDYDRIILSASPVPGSETVSARSGLSSKAVTIGPRHSATLEWRPSGQTVRLRMAPAPLRTPGPASAGRSSLILDADRLTPRIRLRTWQPGDWFCPSGMGGHRKKLQDFWIDAKVPRSIRAKIPVMVAPEGILWVVGLRGDERFRPGPNTTRVLIAEVTSSETHTVTKEP